MIGSWSPSVSIIRHFDRAVIRIPLGSICKNFVFVKCDTKSDELILTLKNITDNRDALQVRDVGSQPSDCCQYIYRSPLLK